MARRTVPTARPVCSVRSALTAYQASLDIRVKLAGAHPANTGWQRDLSIIRQKIDGLDKSGGGSASTSTD